MHGVKTELSAQCTHPWPSLRAHCALGQPCRGHQVACRRPSPAVLQRTLGHVVEHTRLCRALCRTGSVVAPPRALLRISQLPEPYRGTLLYHSLGVLYRDPKSPPQPRYKILYRDPPLARPRARTHCLTPLRAAGRVMANISVVSQASWPCRGALPAVS